MNIRISDSLRFNFLIIGVFLLVWSNNASFVFGETGKQLSLYLGFFIIVIASLKDFLKKRNIVFLLIITVFYATFLAIAFIQNQNTLWNLNIIFGLICFSLLYSGYTIGRNYNRVNLKFELSRNLVFGMAILTIVSATFFYRSQSVYMVYENISRDLGDEAMNPIGIAYTQGILSLILFWLLIQTKNMLDRGILLIALISSFAVISITLSRGAFIYVSLIIGIFYLRRIRIINIFRLKKIRYFIGLLLVLLIFYNYLKNNTFFIAKIEAFTDRLSGLLGIFTSQYIDGSSNERQLMYSAFTSNWTGYFFGQNNYSPYPHNQFMEIWMRWGIFGIPLIFFSIKIFLKSLRIFLKKSLKPNSFLLFVTLIFIFAYLQSLTSMSLEMNRILWFGFGALSGIRTTKMKYI